MCLNQYNVSAMKNESDTNLTISGEPALIKFYNENKDKHFWFMRAPIGNTMLFYVHEETVGHLWWKKTRKVCDFVQSNCNAFDVSMAQRFREYLKDNVNGNVFIKLVASRVYARSSLQSVVCAYDYNVVLVNDADTHKYLNMSELNAFCKDNHLNAPCFEQEEFVFLSLGEIFKKFYDFKKYVYECDNMNYELILCRADEECE